MKNNTRKILIALLLVFTMMMGISAVSASAADTDDGKTTVYFQNNWLWTEVSCYYWGSTTGTNPQWPGFAMTQVGTQDDYQVFALDIPADVTGVVFTGIKNDGSGSLDQSPDITSGIVDGAGWKMVWVDGNAVESFVYDPSAAPTETTYTVAGTKSLCGTDWAPEDTANDLVLGDDGLYTKFYGNVPAGEHKFKVVRNHSWANAWPSSDYVLNLSVASDVTITFNPDTNAVKVTNVPAGETPVEPPVDPGTGGEAGLAGDYYLAGFINGADYGIVGDAANLGIYKFVDGKLTVSFTSDSYVIVKNGNNVAYWAETYCQEKSVVLHNASTGAAEKMFVPAGQVTFTLTQGEGDTLVLTYGGGGSLPTTPTEPAEDPIQPENGYYKIYVYNTAWWDIVDYYLWNDAGEVRTEWPGQEAYEDTYLLYPIMIPADYSFVIFNNGDAIQSVDIPLISIDKSAIVYNNGTGEWMALEDYDPSLEVEKPALPEAPNFDEYEKVKVYLGNSAGWGAANFYVWSNDGTIGAYAAWPGTPMEYDDVLGMYYAEVPVCFENIIFNDGTNQTADLKLPALGDSRVVCDNTLSTGAAGGSQQGDVNPWFSLDDYEAPDPILPPTEDITVVFRNDAGWTEVRLHYWGGDSVTEWPGIVMEMGADGLYYGIIPAGTTGIVFNNGGSWENDTELKSPDLTAPQGSKILFSNGDMQWHDFDLNPDDPDSPDVGGDEPGDDIIEPQLNFFQKLWKAIVEFIQKLLAGFKK